MINKEEVQHIAKLARLELTDKEIIKMQKDMSAILDYFDLLKKAPAFAKASAGKAKENVLRKDEVAKKDNDMAEKLITATPDKKDGYIKVKNIF